MTAYRVGATRTFDDNRVLWLPPAKPTTPDIDWIAVERTAYDDKPQHELTAAETRAAVIVMARIGRTEKDIANRLGINVRQVSRWKYAERNQIGNSRSRGTCTAKGCTRMKKARGLCNAHYKRQRKAEPANQGELRQAA